MLFQTDSSKKQESCDTVQLFENQKRHMDFIEKKVRADVLRDAPRPTGGSGRNLSKEDIMNIRDSAERQAAIAENIELFEGE